MEKQQLTFEQSANDSDAYTLTIPLIDDGCPHSERNLELRLFVENDENMAYVELVLTQPNNLMNEKRITIAREEHPLTSSAVAELLYGVATKQARVSYIPK